MHQDRTPESLRRVTIGDLARELGLSQSSVSTALNDAPGVSPETRARVKSAAATRGWRPHAAARALRTQRSMVIGVTLARDPHQLANESYFPFALYGIEQVLQGRGYSLMLRVLPPDADESEVYQSWSRDRIVDGVIVFDTRGSDPRPERLQALGLPFVIMGPYQSEPQLPQVVAHPDLEAQLLVRHLADLGHRSIAHVTGPLNLGHEVERQHLVRGEAKRLGLALISVEAGYTIEAGSHAARELLARRQPPTAMIGSSDLTALGIISGTTAAGARVPNDLSVVGWDDSLAGQMMAPGLTCLSRHPMEAGGVGAQLLLDLLSDDEPPRSLVRRISPPQLVVRGSTGPASGD